MKISALLVFAFLTCSIFAQNTVIETLPKNKAYLEFGIDPSSIISVGYMRQVNFTKTNMFAFSEISTDMFYPGINNSDAKVGVVFTLLKAHHMQIVNRFNLTAGATKNRNFTSQKISLEDNLAIGHYTQNYYFSFASSYEHIVLNHLINSDYYRLTYYEDAVNGWYEGGGGTIQVGLEGGIRINNKLET